MNADAYPDARSQLRDHLSRIARLLDGEPTAELDRLIAAREAATRIALPLRVLRERAGLDHRALALLVLAALPALDGELAGRLRERIAGATPTLGELLAILGITQGDAGPLIDRLVQPAPLLGRALVALSIDEATPLLHRRLCVDGRIAAFLRGEGLFDQVPAAQLPAAVDAARSSYRPVIVATTHPTVVGATGRAIAEPAIPEAIEHQLVQILAAPRRAGETIELAFTRKERELGELLATLTPIEARALHRRFANPVAGDSAATLFARLVPERRARLLAFLAGARRRYAITATQRVSPAGGH